VPPSRLGVISSIGVDMATGDLEVHVETSEGSKRDNGKVLVRDVLRDVDFRKEIEIELGEEDKRLRVAALELEREQKIDGGPKIDRGHGWGR
jgi:hypothetical protein